MTPFGLDTFLISICYQQYSVLWCGISIAVESQPTQACETSSTQDYLYLRCHQKDYLYPRCHQKPDRVTQICHPFGTVDLFPFFDCHKTSLLGATHANGTKIIPPRQEGAMSARYMIALLSATSPGKARWMQHTHSPQRRLPLTQYQIERGSAFCVHARLEIVSSTTPTTGTAAFSDNALLTSPFVYTGSQQGSI